MTFNLPSLNYAHSALAERGMSQETLELHHDKHHQAYVTALNGFVDANADLQGKSLEEIIALTYGDSDRAPVFNNAGQHWNHVHFWNALSPAGGGIPGALETKLVADFGSVDAFKEAFKAAAIGQFGSGWAWLILQDGKLKVTSTPNQDNPLMDDAAEKGAVLLAADVWEHAYYLKYQNRRVDYLKAFWSVVNWNKVNELYEAAKG